MRGPRIAAQTAKREVVYIVFWTVLMWAIGVAMVLVLTAFFFEPGDGYVLFGSFFSFIGALAGIVSSGNLNGNTSNSHIRHSFAVYSCVRARTEINSDRATRISVFNISWFRTARSLGDA